MRAIPWRSSTRILLTTTWIATAAGAAHAACQGRDLFEDLRNKNSEELRAIEDRAESLPFRRGRFYRVTSGDAAPSFLFGTLHLADSRVTAFSPTIVERLAKASTLAVETTDVTNPGPGGPARELRAALYATPTERADKLLGKSDFAALLALAREQGMSDDSVHKFKPGVLALLLDLPVCAQKEARGRRYVDALLTQQARAAGVPIVGLETLAEQFTAVDGLGPDVERALLLSVLRNAKAGPDVVETQVRRYSENDPGAMLSWMKSQTPVPGLEGAAIPSAFLDRLLDQRSRRMVSRMTPLLAKGNAFIAVGAAHLPGPDGIAALLQAGGYGIERIE